jgi:hypothetical protein
MIVDFHNELKLIKIRNCLYNHINKQYFGFASLKRQRVYIFLIKLLYGKFSYKSKDN